MADPWGLPHRPTGHGQVPPGVARIYCAERFCLSTGDADVHSSVQPRNIRAAGESCRALPEFGGPAEAAGESCRSCAVWRLLPKRLAFRDRLYERDARDLRLKRDRRSLDLTFLTGFAAWTDCCGGEDASVGPDRLGREGGGGGDGGGKATASGGGTSLATGVAEIAVTRFPAMAAWTSSTAGGGMAATGV
jgi:hypothetical protein